MPLCQVNMWEPPAPSAAVNGQGTAAQAMPGAGDGPDRGGPARTRSSRKGTAEPPQLSDSMSAPRNSANCALLLAYARMVALVAGSYTKGCAQKLNSPGLPAGCPACPACRLCAHCGTGCLQLNLVTFPYPQALQGTLC